MICNVWDVSSAKIAEKLNFKAIGTSSAAIANMLGYEDGEHIPFEELLFIVKRIATSTKLPLTVDIEAGYSHDPLITAGYVKALVEAGIVGINIEDSKVDETRTLIDANSFAGYLSAVKGQLLKDQIGVFINVRTDTFLLEQEDALAETKRRMKLYEIAGADGFFLPCITKVEDVEAIVKATTLPVNVMCMPDLPDFKTLTTLGVKRISMGNFLFDKLSNEFENILNAIMKKQSFKTIF
jgi:2-methylisocitrate lyase-like PEP mutase family enzyme